jgi:hypothetical protein
MTKFLAKQLRLMMSILILTIASTVVAADKLAYQIDKDSGLIMAPGWEIVKGNCTTCHSAKFITGQRGDRETWESMIRWMQRTQGLWQIPSETETTILDYLATNYPPNIASRRTNLPPNLMPRTPN